MTIKRILAPLALPFLLVSNGVLADQPPRQSYVGAQYAIFNYSESGFPDYNPSALVLRGGYNFNKYFSVEGRFGFGITDDSHNISPVGDIKLEFDTLYGAYALGRIPLTKSFDLYGVVGYSQVKLTGSHPATGFSDSGDEADFSFGVGAEFYLYSVSFSLEYMSYLRRSELDLSAIGLSVNYNI